MAGLQWCAPAPLMAKLTDKEQELTRNDMAVVMRQRAPAIEQVLEL